MTKFPSMKGLKGSPTVTPGRYCSELGDVAVNTVVASSSSRSATDVDWRHWRLVQFVLLANSAPRVLPTSTEWSP